MLLIHFKVARLLRIKCEVKKSSGCDVKGGKNLKPACKVALNWNKSHSASIDYEANWQRSLFDVG